MQNASRDSTTKSKRQNRRRNSRKKSLSPSNSKNHSAAGDGSNSSNSSNSKKYEYKRSLSEGRGKSKNRKSNIRRVHTHPSAGIPLHELDKYGKLDKENECSANFNNNGVISENRNEPTNSFNVRDNFETDVTLTDNLTVVNGVLSEIKTETKYLEKVYYKFDDKSYVNSSTSECLNLSAFNRGLSPHKAHTDESVSDDSTFVLEITSSDRDTEDERRSHYECSNLTFDILNEEIQAMFKERFQRLGEELAASTLSYKGFDFAKMFSQQTADPIIKYAREQIAQDFNNCKELESLAMSTLRRVSVRRKRRSPDYGSSGGDQDRSELDAGRMQPEDYKLVFISSDSSSREEEGDELGSNDGTGVTSGADGAWDYWEAGGRWRRPRRPRRAISDRCVRPGRSCRCGAAPRVLAVPVPVPVPVPAALWPALLGPAAVSMPPSTSVASSPADNGDNTPAACADPHVQSCDDDTSEYDVCQPAKNTMTVAKQTHSDDSPRIDDTDNIDITNHNVETITDHINLPEPTSSSAAESSDDSDRESQRSASFSRVFVVNPSDWSSGEDDVDANAPSGDEADEDSSGECVLLKYTGQDINGELVEVHHRETVLLNSSNDKQSDIEEDSLDMARRQCGDESEDQSVCSGEFLLSGTECDAERQQSATRTQSSSNAIESSTNHKNCVNFIKFCDLNMLHNTCDEIKPFFDIKQSDGNVSEFLQIINTELSVPDCSILSSDLKSSENNVSRTNSVDSECSDIAFNKNGGNFHSILCDQDIVCSNNNELKEINDLSKNNDSQDYYPVPAKRNFISSPLSQQKVDIISNENILLEDGYFKENMESELNKNDKEIASTQKELLKTNLLHYSNHQKELNCALDTLAINENFRENSLDPELVLKVETNERSPIIPALISKEKLFHNEDSIGNDKYDIIQDCTLKNDKLHNNERLDTENRPKTFLQARGSMFPLLENSTESKGGEIDLVRGIERTLSELLIKETISMEGLPTASDEGGTGPTGAPPVSWPRSPRADVTRYTSRVMITQENPLPSISAPSRVTVQHAHSISKHDINDTSKVEFDGGVSVVTNASTLSAVVCLEEGLADDDSWVEEGSRWSLSDLTDTDSGDEVEFRRDEGEYAACRRSILDFTLHTIVEESCEESEPDRAALSRPASTTELEKYFFYGLADGRRAIDDEDDVVSETSSPRSETADSIGGVGEADPTESADPDGLASSRLERYFLTGFMGFSQERRDSDGSGSVGSDSEGRRSPARRKRLVRPRGSERIDQEQPVIRLDERISSSDEGDTDEVIFLESSPNTGSLDAQHRKKQTKKRRNSPADERRYSLEARDEHLEEVRSVSDQDDGRQTPRQEFLPVNSELANCKKQTSRDSGFVGSCDDLLKSNDSHIDTHLAKTQDLKLDLEEIAEENRQDFEEKHDGSNSYNRNAANTLIRKDSFNNWSSDEETNLMMSKMRQFFKSMVAASANAQNAAKNESNGKLRRGEKPPQLAHFESELTRLMKTVPGIRDEEVREIVEYLSSEDAWSDSYDSSDYNGSDMESATSGRSALRKQISESCREIIDEFDRAEIAKGVESAGVRGDADCVYRKLVASLGDSSPPLAAKVIQHIGSRLVALMHEVSAGSAEEGEEAEVEEAPRRLGLGRSRSHDVLGGASGVPRAAPDIIDERDASDGERFSWRGSFESALLAEPSPGGAMALSLAAAGSGERLERVRSLGALTAGGAGSGGNVVGTSSAAGAGSLPRLAVKSARHRAAAAAAAAGGSSLARGRAASAPGLAVLHGQRRRRTPHQPTSTITATASADDICSSDLLYSSINSPSTLCSSSPIPSTDCIINSGSQEHEDDISRLVAMHNRSGLQARCESLASVYSGAGEGIRGSVVVRGAVQFALLYNYRLGSLDVVVKRCQDLAPVDTKRNKSDPYVKVYLLPDKSKGGKRKTRVRKGTLQPVWDETLRFSAPLAALTNRTLWLSVWHADLLGRNDFLGEVRLPLANRTFDDTQPQWYTLQERTEHFDDNQGSKGDLIVAIKFELPDHVNANNLRAKGTLHVLVKEAKNLCASKTNGLADAFCKSYLLPERSRASKQKTAVIRRTLNPRWEHCFSYSDVSANELKGRALELSVWDRDRFSSNDFMGGVRFSLGTGIYSGSAVEWMDSTGREVTLWETMLQRHNFWVEGSLPLRSSLTN